MQIVLDQGPAGSWDSLHVYINGAVITPDGRVALSYCAETTAALGDWNGIGMAFADEPMGPFVKHPDNPLIRVNRSTGSTESIIHEHTLNRLENGSYLIFYAGCCGENQVGAYAPFGVGDQGHLAYSEDLIHWRKAGVVFPTPSIALRDVHNGDGTHRRPRSLHRIGEYWHLLYEGASPIIDYQVDPSQRDGWVMNGALWRDSVGLARAPDLKGPWEPHPLKLSVPQGSGVRFDAAWTGWPRAIVQQNPAGGTVQIFYAAQLQGGPGVAMGGQTIGRRRVDTESFTSWDWLSTDF